MSKHRTVDIPINVPISEFDDATVRLINCTGAPVTVSYGDKRIVILPKGHRLDLEYNLYSGTVHIPK